MKSVAITRRVKTTESGSVRNAGQHISLSKIQKANLYFKTILGKHIPRSHSEGPDRDSGVQCVFLMGDRRSWRVGADCKSVALPLSWFDSIITHQKNIVLDVDIVKTIMYYNAVD